MTIKMTIKMILIHPSEPPGACSGRFFLGGDIGATSSGRTTWANDRLDNISGIIILEYHSSFILTGVFTMTRQRDITPTAVRTKDGRFTGRYEFNIYTFNRHFTNGVICGAFISGVSILIAIYMGS